MYSLLAAMGTAGGEGATGGSLVSTIIMFGAIIAIFYFMLIRPQRKRDRETKDMLSAIKKGDKVVSIGGIRGTVVAVKESTIIVKVDDNTRLEFSKNAISSVLNKSERKQTAAENSKKKDSEEKAESSKKKGAEAAEDAEVVEVIEEVDVVEEPAGDSETATE